MKQLKLFVLPLLAMLLVFSSCEKEDKKVATYSITCEETYGYEQTLRIFEFNDQGDKLYDHKIEDVDAGRSYFFTAHSANITKIKIYVSVEGVFTSYDKWVQRVYYLDKDNTTEIILDGSTVIGPDEP